MSLTAARALAGVYFTLMLVFVTWPGLVAFSRVEPLILGLPFSMAWIAAWIAGSVIVLTVVDRVETRYREAGDPRATPGVGPVRSDESDRREAADPRARSHEDDAPAGGGEESGAGQGPGDGRRNL